MMKGGPMARHVRESCNTTEATFDLAIKRLDMSIAKIMDMKKHIADVVKKNEQCAPIDPASMVLSAPYMAEQSRQARQHAVDAASILDTIRDDLDYGWR